MRNVQHLFSLFCLALFSSLQATELRSPVLLPSKDKQIIQIEGTNPHSYRKETFSIRRSDLLSSHLSKSSAPQLLAWTLTLTTKEIETVILYDESNKPLNITQHKKITLYFSSQKTAQKFNTQIF